MLEQRVSCQNAEGLNLIRPSRKGMKLAAARVILIIGPGTKLPAMVVWGTPVTRFIKGDE